MDGCTDRHVTDATDKHDEALAGARRGAFRRKLTRRVVVAAGTLALAGVATAGVVTAGGQSNPARARAADTQANTVSVTSNGGVLLTVRDLEKIGSLNKRLRRLGLPVRAVRVRHGCTMDYTSSPDRLHRVGNAATIYQERLLLDVRDLPAGETIVIGLGTGKNVVLVGTDRVPDRLVAVTVGQVEGRAPSCVADIRPTK